MNAKAARSSSSDEPGYFLAGALAILIHVVFVVFMVFGLNWKTYPPEGMVVDLWSDLPQPVKSSPPQPQKVEPSKPTPAPAPASRPVQAEPSPPKTKPAPPLPSKPDIAQKTKAEKLKPVREEVPVETDNKEKEREKEKEKEREREKEKERERVKEKEREQEKQKEKEREEERKKAETERLQREQALQQKREQEAVAQQREAQQAAARARLATEVDKYKAMILAKIRSRIIMPPDLPGNPVVEYRVTLLPGGDILEVSLRKSSGFAVFDSAVERAIFLSKPLPLPPDSALFSQFRNLSIIVHYHE